MSVEFIGLIVAQEASETTPGTRQPHIAAWVPGHDAAQLARFRDNLNRFRHGAPLVGVIDPARGY
jgi:hypothetical protein